MIDYDFEMAWQSIYWLFPDCTFDYRWFDLSAEVPF